MLTIACAGDVELLEAITACSEVLQSRRGTQCSTTTELHAGLFRGMAYFGVVANFSYINCLNRDATRRKWRVPYVLYIFFL
jgi:hypothetical protein